MTDEASRMRGDAVFLRGLADSVEGAGVRAGAVLAAAGSVFPLVALQYWALDVRLIALPPAWRSWLWLDGLAVFLPLLAVLQARMRGTAVGPGARAMSAAWAGLGVALACAVVALALAGWRLSLPLLAAWVFPVVLFTLAGASWGIAFAVQRRTSHALAAGGSGIAAIICGVLVGSPGEWLALAAGLWLLLALPGWGILLRGRTA